MCYLWKRDGSSLRLTVFAVGACMTVTVQEITATNTGHRVLLPLSSYLQTLLRCFYDDRTNKAWIREFRKRRDRDWETAHRYGVFINLSCIMTVSVTVQEINNGDKYRPQGASSSPKLPANIVTMFLRWSHKQGVNSRVSKETLKVRNWFCYVFFLYNLYII